MMDGNLYLKYGRASCCAAAMLAVFKGSRKERSYKRKNTKRK
jgi:hypothetical protein